LAYNWAGYMTYPAIRGFGPAQFYLLTQLRVAIIAVAKRIQSGVPQPNSVWISLLQLVTGMVVLVFYKAHAVAGEVGCHFLPADARSHSEAGDGAIGTVLAPPEATSQSQVLLNEDGTSFLVSFAAMIGVILTSAFGALYLEQQLKSHSKDALFIQLHQLNAFAVSGSLLVAMRRSMEAPVDDASNSSALAPDAPAADSASAVLVPLRVLLSVSCVVARGSLNGTVLKRLDALTKGFIDVTAIVLCTVLQIFVNGRSADATAIGLQIMMLLSVLGFVTARQAPATNPRGPGEAKDFRPSALQQLPKAL